MYYLILDDDGNINRAIEGVHEIENYRLKKIVSREIFDMSIDNFSELGFFNPKIKKELIKDFLKTSDFNNLSFFLEECPKLKVEHIKKTTQQEKDIKFLAEFNKSLVEAMPLPSEGQPNQMLQKLQDIIDRYS